MGHSYALNICNAVSIFLPVFSRCFPIFPIYNTLAPRFITSPITLDRTTWEYGKSCINILVLAVVWRGVAIPVLWETLDKKGNSNTGERMVLLELFRETFPEVHIETRYADREFIGNIANTPNFSYIQVNRVV